MFSINGTTGEIQTLVQLDREDIDLYSFVVSAEDGGSPPTSTDVQVVVTVGDVNDNDPYFTEGVNITVEIYEVRDYIFSHKPVIYAADPVECYSTIQHHSSAS